MVLPTTRYNAAYFGDIVESGGIKDIAGYTGGYKTHATEKFRFTEGLENLPFNPKWRDLTQAISVNINFTNKKILDVGGAIGPFADEGKNTLGARVYDVIDVSNWCARNVLPDVDNFLEGNALDVLPTLRNNEYDIILSMQFLDCIDDTDLPTLISEMNRVSKTQQLHWVTETINRSDTRDFYNLKTINDWAIGRGWQSGTTIFSHNTKSSITVL